MWERMKGKKHPVLSIPSDGNCMRASIWWILGSLKVWTCRDGEFCWKLPQA